MTRGIFQAASFAAVSFALACAGQAEPEAAVPTDPAGRLEAILATPITLEQDSIYAAFAAEQGADMMLLLPALAVNREADPLARANAVLRMAAHPVHDFEVFRFTIEDPDPRVRGATLAAVGPIATHRWDDALPILAKGLVDPVVGVQAKALQELRDRDLEVLRFYVANELSPPELREIALQTIRNAHAWGEPVEPEPDGTLRRVTPAGVELAVRPARSFPEFDLVIGPLSAARPNATPRLLADSIEVVNRVIPAVADPAGRYLALERARRIEVHDLEDGTVRSIGPGIAPRPMPFTTDFFFFRELRRTDVPDGSTRLVYEMVRAPFGAGEPMPFDTVTIVADPGVRGKLSPARWARIRDWGARFVIDSDGGLRNRPLPMPLQ
ncbi:MAG TPA: hypothetical protein VEA38_01965 [Terriglobales bacterium]|nr:hypothetical protein [Terriglobales bacterium]